MMMQRRMFSTRHRPLNFLYEGVLAQRRVWHDPDAIKQSHQFDPKKSLTGTSWGRVRQLFMHNRADEKVDEHGVPFHDILEITKRVRSFGNQEQLHILGLVNISNNTFADRIELEDMIPSDPPAPTPRQMTGLDPAVKTPVNYQRPENNLSKFRTLYELAYYTSLSRRPYAPFIHGRIEGPGVAIAMHSKFCVASERTMFSVQGPGIGWFPDNGESYFLSRTHNEGMGMFLAMTGLPLHGYELLEEGICSFLMHSGDFEHFVSSMKDQYVHSGVLEAFHQYNDIGISSWKEELKGGPTSYTPYLGVIKECFAGKESLEDIIMSLEKQTTHQDWCTKIIKLIKERAPLSLNIAIRQINLAKNMTLAECLEMDYQIAGNMVRNEQYPQGLLMLNGKIPAGSITWAETTPDEVESMFVPQRGATSLGLTNLNFKTPELIQHDSRFTPASYKTTNVDIKTMEKQKSRTVRRFGI